jgi:hypothetical protein
LVASPKFRQSGYPMRIQTIRPGLTRLVIHTKVWPEILVGATKCIGNGY